MTDTNMTDASGVVVEAVGARIARLGLTEISEMRLESLRIAHEAGVADDVFRKLGDAVRLNRRDTIILPKDRLENLSRGKGWARKGRGEAAEWGEREDNGYRVGPGKWVVGGNDGFRRKNETSWVVEHVKVGEQTWTVAN